MADRSGSFGVALEGFSDREIRLLHSTLEVSSARRRRYVLCSQTARADILVIDSDCRNGSPDRPLNLPVLWVGQGRAKAEALSKGPHAFAKRPLLAVRILKALDDLAAEAYDLVPDLDVYDGMSETATADLASMPTRRVGGEHERILLVDDSEVVRKSMQVWLVNKGFAVDAAATGEQALEYARYGSYCLVFLDVVLPDIDGYEVSRRLKQYHGLRAPVVMVTGKGSQVDKLRGKLAGASAHLTKPLKLADLNTALDRFVSP